MRQLPDNYIDLTLTDIPYDEVNRDDSGLRNLNKGDADILLFSLDCFLDEVYRVTKSTVIVFCGEEQVSSIHKYFSKKQRNHKGTVRQLIWEKTNPSPMNGKYIYLSGIENIMWFKKSGGTFNAHCKNVVFRYPTGRSKLHPTEKNHKLLEELICDNSNENDIILDPCCGSGSHLFISKQLNRNFIGFDISEEYCNIARKRINNISTLNDWLE